MNNRIKELVVESGNGLMRDGKLYPHIGLRTQEDWEKFAELIIKECASHLNYCCDEGGATELLEHFGIEQ